MVVPRVGPNFPAALAIAPSAPAGAGARAGNAWEHDSADDIVAFGIAGRIWESAFLLRRYVDRDAPWIFDPPCTLHGTDAPLTVLELGAGVGTAGLALAQALHDPSTPHTVILTDLPDVVPLLQRNARTAQAHGQDVRVCALPWGDARAATAAVRAAPRPLTHILCSDLVYFPELLAPLLRTLLDLTSTEHPIEVVIGYRIRSLTKEQPFWAALGSWFDFRAVYCAPKSRPDVWVPFGSDATHLSHGPPGAVPDDYFVFVAHRKPHTLSQTAPHSDAALLAGHRVTEEATQTYDPDLSGVDTFEWLMLSRSM
ncbi:hypothetical protein MBRA1_002791 [Malassezia brasiliensis]|uniref:Methyltransferase-domain-containing protein n=1 Tax=Malassezia brasiliensis TaxID=1821822 RepID=A0AAF0IQH8_9BASI|nr:hypothetical protein MBRA1_002791 [Malassezia brasiliensis]